MKNVIVVIAIMACSALAFGATDLPKDIDTVDYVLEAPSRLVIEGELTVDSPIFHRWRPASYEDLGLNCDLEMTSDYSNEPYFELFCFNVSDSEPVEFLVDPADFDTVIYIYCDPFNPDDATLNGVFMDDDDGPGLLSAITVDDGVTLAPGADYWLLVCSYGANATGTFTVTTSDNVVLCGTVATDEVEFGMIKSLYR